MNRDERAIARTLFKLKIYQADGQSFETLFTDIMGKLYPDFVSVKPQGQLGDRKNDGYDRKHGRYYQVFAPENINKSQSQAVKKLATDFKGLFAYWQPITPVKEFYFVFNDKYKGTFPSIEKDLSTLKQTYHLKQCASFLSKHLEDNFFSLADDEIISIVGHIPNPALITGQLDYSILNEVITHILNYKQQLSPQQTLTAPNFNQKITFNHLSPQIDRLLTVANYKSGSLENYFELNSNFTKQELRDKLNDLYNQAIKTTFENADDTTINDLVFFDILKKTTPNDLAITQDAALVIMAYYFESCDIFEDPEQSEAN